MLSGSLIFAFFYLALNVSGKVCANKNKKIAFKIYFDDQTLQPIFQNKLQLFLLAFTHQHTPTPKCLPGEITNRTVLNVFGPAGHGGRYILDSLKVSYSAGIKNITSV